MKTAALILLLAPARLWANDVIAVVEDSAGKPVSDAVVFVFETPGTYPAPPAPVDMNQVNKEFSPHVLPVLVGSRVKFPNKDQIHHHIYSFSKAKKFEVPLYKGEEGEPVLLDQSGLVKLGCNIHDWMLAYVLVLDNPYFAKTGSDGRAVLSGIPEGKYRFAVWSERLKGPVENTLQSAPVGKSVVKLQFRPKLGPARKLSQPPMNSY